MGKQYDLNELKNHKSGMLTCSALLLTPRVYRMTMNC